MFHDAAVVEFDGSVVLAGFSDGNFSGLNSFSFADNNLSDDDNSDLNPQPVAVKLGLDDGHELWRWSLVRVRVVWRVTTNTIQSYGMSSTVQFSIDCSV